MPFLIGLIVVFLIIFYKRSTEIIKVNPLSGARPSVPRPDGEEPSAGASDTIDFGRLINTISEAAQHQAGGGSKLPRSREAVLKLVRNNQFIEAIALYRRLYGTDLQTAKKAVDKMMLTQGE